MSFLPFTTVRDLDSEPVGHVTIEFVPSTWYPHTWMVACTPRGDDPHLHMYGPFASPEDATDWADHYVAPYSAYTVTALAAPYTLNGLQQVTGKPVTRACTAPRAASVRKVAKVLKAAGFHRFRADFTGRTGRRGFTAAALDDAVEVRALGPRAQLDLVGMTACLQRSGQQYAFETTGPDSDRVLVRRQTPAQAQDRAEAAASRVAPFIDALLAGGVSGDPDRAADDDGGSR
ncbi:hypothetical protein OIE69_44370 (plasmid) [Actinacidiphila glaucinigra]|uniref:hypothetical protein n=1 Tax=Actinacidiphila glaucinigra TaxID=235986 RepID=UPI002DDC57AA|nr:hypothetical protein [Actinacidiphila glaucinigra]WSD65941.1 hypothetical protein OIE69_44370 [Actinacidiphila glaucinigra]